MPTTEYIWDVVTDNVIMEKDGTGTTQAVYTQEPELYGSLISQDRGGETSYYHYDGSGNTRALTDGAEDVLDTYTYSAFGNDISSTGLSVNSRRFGGRYGYQHNDETLDYYVRARIYRTRIGQWISVDPVRFFTHAAGVSGYRYLGSTIDPSGLVVRDFKPAKPDKMPWCDFAFPPNIIGETVPIVYNVACACQCCNMVLSRYELKCIVRAYLEIRLNYTRKIAHGFSLTLPEAYGHEQRHVKNLLEGAEKWAAEAEKREKLVGCGEWTLCHDHAGELEVVGTLVLSINWANREKRHEHPSGDPVEDTGHPPIGATGVSGLKSVGPQKKTCGMPPPTADPPDKLCPMMLPKEGVGRGKPFKVRMPRMLTPSGPVSEECE